MPKTSTFAGKRSHDFYSDCSAVNGPLPHIRMASACYGIFTSDGYLAIETKRRVPSEGVRPAQFQDQSVPHHL